MTVPKNAEPTITSIVNLQREIPSAIDTRGVHRRDTAEALLHNIVHEVKHLGYGSLVSVRIAITVTDQKDFDVLSKLSATVRIKQFYRKEFGERISVAHDRHCRVIHVAMNEPRSPRRERRR